MSDSYNLVELKVSLADDATAKAARVKSVLDAAGKSQERLEAAARKQRFGGISIADARDAALGPRGGQSKADTPGRYAGREGGMAGKAAGAFKGGGAVAGAAAVYGALVEAAGKAANGINLLRNSSLTAAQQIQGLAEEFIPGAAVLRRFADAVDGTSERVRKAGVNYERDVVGIQADAQERARKSELGAELSGVRATANAVRDNRLGVMERFDRNTALGARAAAEQEVRQPAKDAQVEARRQQQSTKEALRDQDVRVRDANVRAIMAKNKRDLAATQFQGWQDRENITGRRDKAGGIEAANKLALADRDLGLAEVQRQTELNRQRELGVKYAEAESAVRKGNIEASKAELEVLKQKEDRMAGTAQRLGSMGRGEFELRKEALRQVKAAGGLENVPPELAALAGEIAPEYIAKQREQLGGLRGKEVAKEFRGLDDSTVKDFENATLKEVRAQVDGVKADVRIQIDLDAQQVADDIFKRTRDVFGELIKAIEAQVKTIKNGVVNEQQRRWAGEH